MYLLELGSTILPLNWLWFSSLAKTRFLDEGWRLDFPGFCSNHKTVYLWYFPVFRRLTDTSDCQWEFLELMKECRYHVCQSQDKYLFSLRHWQHEFSHAVSAQPLPWVHGQKHTALHIRYSSGPTPSSILLSGKEKLNKMTVFPQTSHWEKGGLCQILTSWQKSEEK